MRIKIRNILSYGSFWLSLICHLLLLLSLIFVWKMNYPLPPSVTPPYISSYTYQEKSNSTLQQVNQQASVGDHQLASKKGIEKPASKLVSQKPNTQQQLHAIQVAHRLASAKVAKTNDDVYLIGEKGVVKPLIKLLGKALAAHLVYPKIAIDYHLRGTAVIGFSLHPDGSITHAQLVKSSGAEVLDNAALAALHAMAPIKDVNAYLTEPTFLVVGIIFG